MDKQTQIDELKQKVRLFCEARDWDQYHNPKDLAIGITTEAAELLDIFRFKSEAEMEELFQDPIKQEQISDEVADIFFFLLRFAQRNNISLTSALENKMIKNNDKYPVEVFKGSNKKYSEI